VIKQFNRDQLLELTKSTKTVEACSECASLSCPGWVSVPGYFDLAKLKVVGTLSREGSEECWDEYHPHGTHIWSEDAPIALNHHPYNRADVRECVCCKRTFLHYTEYGGYYLDERIRELNGILIVE
jgi:hypothetical protein